MLQFSKKMQLHADYGTRVMETETIQKNEASPKSLMSRRNLISKFFYSVMVAMVIVSFVSCEKDKDDGLTEDVHNLVPDEVLNAAKDLGFVINGGKKPPMIEGAYKISPTILVKSSFDDAAEPGRKFNDAWFAFSDQNNANLTVMTYLEEDSYWSGSGEGKIRTYITGKSNKFTVYVPMSEYSSGDTYAGVVFMISGEFTDSGIKNCLLALMMIDNHGNSGLIGNGQGRLFKDGDGLAERIETSNKLKSAKAETAIENAGLWNFLQKVK